jgi:PTH2 family peptidyl-tRNA hydrolase
MSSSDFRKYTHPLKKKLNDRVVNEGKGTGLMAGIEIIPFRFDGRVENVCVYQSLERAFLLNLLGSAFSVDPATITLHRDGIEVTVQNLITGKRDAVVDVVLLTKLMEADKDSEKTKEEDRAAKVQAKKDAKAAKKKHHTEAEEKKKEKKGNVTIQCCDGHALCLFQTPHKGFCCDNCRNTVKKGAAMQGCRKCDFDLCSSCVDVAAEAGEEEFYRQMKLREEEEDEEDDEDDEDENWYIEGQDEPPPEPDEELKMVLCVRQDLKMGKGKLAAQCCHAAVACFHQSASRQPLVTRQYEWYGAAKVALKANDEATIRQIFDAAREAGLVTYLVADAGRTQIATGTRTVCGVGPAPKSEIDKLTGPNGKWPLKLL